MSLADQFLFSDVRGTGLQCVDEGFFICESCFRIQQKLRPSRMNSLCELYKKKSSEVLAETQNHERMKH